ncbi:MAG: hypothetical protein ABW321_33425 [Polyangiales bacterium]
MRDTRAWWWGMVVVVGCATAGSAGSPSDDIVTVTRDAQVVHLDVTTAESCPPRQTTCVSHRPVADAEIVLRTRDGERVLGRTSSIGRLDVSLAELDAQFSGRKLPPDERAQVLLHDHVAAELPLGEILDRKRVIDATLAEADRLLEDSSPDRDYGQQLLVRLLDLQMRGIADPRISERSERLYEHLRENESFFAAPQRWFNKAKELVARLRSSGDDAEVPEPVKHDLEQTVDTGKVESGSFAWAISKLPTMCKITVRGGAVVAAQFIAAGAPGVALAIIAASVGDDLSNWLIHSCCEMARKSLEDAPATTCGPPPAPPQ